MGGFLEPAKRRDVAGLRIGLGELAVGDTASVVCSSSRYGDVQITGRLRETLTGELCVGGRVIGGAATSVSVNGADFPARQPSGELKSIETEDDERLHGSEVSAAEIEHGDLISADFDAEPHGGFTVVGIATAGQDRFLLVGEWIIRDGDEPAPRLARVRRIARYGEHLVPVPAVREPLTVG